VSGNQPPYDDYWRSNPDADETERFSNVEGPSPWYLKRWILTLWGLAVVILIALIIWGLAILARGNGGSVPAPTTTRTSTTASTTTTTSPTPSTTEPTTTTPSEETTIEPSPTATWTPQHPHRHRWLTNLPPIPQIPPIPHF
jgi:cytoskeletal protein RodZ